MFAESAALNLSATRHSADHYEIALKLFVTFSALHLAFIGLRTFRVVLQ